MFKKLISLLKDKPRVYDIVFEADTPAGRKFDIMVIIAISVSLIVMFVESLQIVDGYIKFALEIIEGCLTFFFTAEYLVRLYCSPTKRDYALSFFGVIDFLATIPPYLAILLPPARYMLVFRAFRFIRVFRIFKLFSFINEGFLLLESIRRSMTKILVYFLFVWILVICIGTLMFIMEGNSAESAFSDLPTSIYWAIVTMTTVGYGDIVPVTATGRFLAGMVMVLGYTIIAVPTGIVSATMVDLTKEAVKDGLCPRCGGKVDEEDRFCKHCGEKL
jgi:voltage-gated potassium channel